MTTATKSRNRGPLGNINTPTETDNSKKWISGITQQTENANKHLNVQYIPLEQIELDTQNARNLSISIDLIKQCPKIDPSIVNDELIKEYEQVLLDFAVDCSDKEKLLDDYRSLVSLALSIQAPDKLINPITVYSDDMTFHVIAGHRRTLAHHLLGVDVIAAKILSSKPNNVELSIIQWKENDDREDLSLFDQISSLKRVIKTWKQENNSTISIRKLMNIINIKQTRAVWYLKVINSVEDNSLLNKAIQSGNLESLEIAYKIATIENQKEQQFLLQQIIDGNKLSYDVAKTSLSRQGKKYSSDLAAKINISGLTIKKKTNLNAVSKILNAALMAPELQSLKSELTGLDLDTKKGLMEAWVRLYSHFESI